MSSLAGLQECIAADREPAYNVDTPELDVVVATLRDAVERLAAVDLAAASAPEVGQAITALVEVQTAAAAQESRLVRDFDGRAGYRQDGCVTATSWLRHRTRLGYGEAQRRVKRARLLARLTELRAAFEAGAITVKHVDAVVDRVIPQRVEAIAANEHTLVELAARAEPREVALAVRRIVELADRDGTQDPPECGREDLRELRLRQGYSGLGHLEGAVTPLLHELLLRVRDVYSSPDPADTPVLERSTESQRFHDALQAALAAALDQHPGSGVGGVRTHVVLFADLFTLLGRDELARIRPRLSRGGIIDPEVARHLIATSNPTLRAVLALGPWRVVNVGRAFRFLPDWLRTASELAHHHCRGPGCDRPFAWTDNDHSEDWVDGGETALTNDVPLCRAHHRLKHQDHWKVTFDPDTGTVTWTSADGTRRFDIPPPDP